LPHVPAAAICHTPCPAHVYNCCTTVVCTRYAHVLKDVCSAMSVQVKPQGGIFIDQFQEDSEALDVHYTLVADELALSHIRFNTSAANITGVSNVSKMDIDVHRR